MKCCLAFGIPANIIMAPGEVQMGGGDQRQAALRTLEYCVRDYASWFATYERAGLDPSQAECRRLYIESLAAKLGRLAELIPEVIVSYDQVQSIITDLYNCGFYPDKQALSAVVHAFLDKKIERTALPLASDSKSLNEAAGQRNAG